MKFYTVAAILALSTQAINISETKSDSKGDWASADVELREMTIVGFFFDGLDFGMLWSDLTEDQKNECKKNLFSQTLQFNGFDSNNYADGVFKFTDEQRAAAIAKSESAAEAPGKKHEKNPKETTVIEDTKKEEKTLAQHGWAGYPGWRGGWGYYGGWPRFNNYWGFNNWGWNNGCAGPYCARPYGGPYWW